MKKLLGIVDLGLLWCNVSFADDDVLNEFNQFLYDNGHHQYLNLESKYICKVQPKFSNIWYYNNCDKFNGSNNLDIKFFKSSEIPWGSNPNKDTLLYYLFKNLDSEDSYDKVGSKASNNPTK